MACLGRAGAPEPCRLVVSASYLPGNTAIHIPWGLRVTCTSPSELRGHRRDFSGRLRPHQPSSRAIRRKVYQRGQNGTAVAGLGPPRGSRLRRRPSRAAIGGPTGG